MKVIVDASVTNLAVKAKDELGVSLIPPSGFSPSSIISSVIRSFQVWFEHWKDLITLEIIELGEKPEGGMRETPSSSLPSLLG